MVDMKEFQLNPDEQKNILFSAVDYFSLTLCNAWLNMLNPLSCMVPKSLCVFPNLCIIVH